MIRWGLGCQMDMLMCVLMTRVIDRHRSIPETPINTPGIRSDHERGAAVVRGDGRVRALLQEERHALGVVREVARPVFGFGFVGMGKGVKFPPQQLPVLQTRTRTWHDTRGINNAPGERRVAGVVPLVHVHARVVHQVLDDLRVWIMRVCGSVEL